MKRIIVLLCLLALLLTSCANAVAKPTEQQEPAKCMHTEKETITLTLATCTTAGMVQVKCKTCGENLGVDYTPAEGHSMTKATCTEAARCSKCGVVSGTALGHNIVNGVCSRCGFVATGSLAGTLTCGSSGAAGASIFLIPNRDLKSYDGRSVFFGQGKDESGIIVASSDGVGNYRIEDIPVGTYYLVVSNGSKGTGFMGNRSGLTSRLKAILGPDDYHSLELLYIGETDYSWITTVNIEQNQTASFSWNF